MITFNNIVSKFQEFVDNHYFLKTFSYGSPADVDLDKFEQYPLLHLVYTGGDYNSPKAKTYNLEVYILSLPPSEADKVGFQKESISDAEQVAEDILADIQNGGNIFQFGYKYDLVNASVTPLEEENSNALAGCLLDIAISVPYAYDSCNAPLTGVEPDGTPPTSYKARGLLRVRELDGSPDVLSVATINVPNGSLTDDGDGVITLDFATLVQNIGDLGDVTETALTAGQLLYYDGAGWINKTVVGGSAVASVIWTGNTSTVPMGTWPSSYLSVKYPSAATVTPAGSFSILYNSALNSLQVSGLSTGTSIAYNAKFGVTPAVVNDIIDVRMRAFFSNSPVFSDTEISLSQSGYALPVDEEAELVVSGNFTVGSHPTVDIFLETASFYAAGTARCIDFEITFT